MHFVGLLVRTALPLGAALLNAAAVAAPFDILDAVQNGVEGVQGIASARAVAVSPNGAQVYVAGFAGNAVAGFAVAPGTGALTFLGAVVDGAASDGLLQAADVAVSPDGRHVYVAAFGDDAIAILSRNDATGSLTYVDAVFDADLPSTALNGASGVAVSPDGEHVYATAGVGDTFAAFSRDADTGLLTLVEIEDNDPSQLLDDPADLAISPNGALVYVISQGFTNEVAADSLLTFERNPTTGEVTRIDSEQDQAAGVSGLELPNGVATSPDGHHIYTGAGLSSSIAVFAHSPVDDSTGFLAAYQEGSGGVTGLLATVGVAVTPDGAHVLATGFAADALAVFDRDPSGFLTFDRAIRDDADAGRLLDGAIDVAVDPQGRFVYVASFVENSLTVLAPEPGAAAGAAVAAAALAFRRRRAQTPRSVSR